MEFDVSGCRYTCPLCYFQARTQVVVEQPLEVAVDSPGFAVQKQFDPAITL